MTYRCPTLAVADLGLFPTMCCSCERARIQKQARPRQPAGVESKFRNFYVAWFRKRFPVLSFCEGLGPSSLELLRNAM